MPKEYIERDKLIKKAYPFPCAIGIEYAVTVRAIHEMPTADVVEVVHGRWLQNEPETIYCSECNYSVWSYYNTPYCSNCGTKMDGKDEQH